MDTDRKIVIVNFTKKNVSSKSTVDKTALQYTDYQWKLSVQIELKYLYKIHHREDIKIIFKLLRKDYTNRTNVSRFIDLFSLKGSVYRRRNIGRCKLYSWKRLQTNPLRRLKNYCGKIGTSFCNNYEKGNKINICVRIVCSKSYFSVSLTILLKVVPNEFNRTIKHFSDLTNGLQIRCLAEGNDNSCAKERYRATIHHHEDPESSNPMEVKKCENPHAARLSNLILYYNCLVTTNYDNFTTECFIRLLHQVSEKSIDGIKSKFIYHRYFVNEYDISGAWKGKRNLEWQVAPSLSKDAAMPVHAAQTIFFSIPSNVLVMAEYKYVFPVPPGPSTDGVTIEKCGVAPISRQCYLECSEDVAANDVAYALKRVLQTSLHANCRFASDLMRRQPNGDVAPRTESNSSRIAYNSRLLQFTVYMRLMVLSWRRNLGRQPFRLVTVYDTWYDREKAKEEITSAATIPMNTCKFLRSFDKIAIPDAIQIKCLK
ncbi:hypothetical protein Bhyg_05893 [Pseudolycoriella hygida]|uniref:Uncharacterized protein n=1 Tax=Pseudolycoriella hygida TaxID=35572 RepID=A0A9Q0S2B4_9DIPT|nr:hypothetical protein Bhyg_05893 [Pseudolycoriella hygida]